ncbi:MAG: hypothetical protein AAGU10_03765 [Methanosarcina mazei]
MDDVKELILSKKEYMEIFDSIIIKNKLWNKFRGPNEIFRWLGNFDKEEVYFALKLANNISYYYKDQIKYLYSLILNKEVKLFLLSRSSESEYISDIEGWFQRYLQDKCIFIGYGQAGDSGQHMVYTFKKSHKIRFLNYMELSQFLTLSEDDIVNKEVVFLLDDFVGSGNQAINNWNSDVAGKSFRSISEEYPHLQFVYLVLVGFKEGKEKIEGELPIKVIIGDELDETCKCFSDTSIIFEEPSERNNAKNVMVVKGKKLVPRMPLGFNNMQSVVAFDHNTPNDSLPVIWVNKSDGSWCPLFERSS